MYLLCPLDGCLYLVEPAGNDPASGEVRFGFNPRRNLSQPHFRISSQAIRNGEVFFRCVSVFFCLFSNIVRTAFTTASFSKNRSLLRTAYKRIGRSLLASSHAGTRLPIAVIQMRGAPLPSVRSTRMSVHHSFLSEVKNKLPDMAA